MHCPAAAPYHVQGRIFWRKGFGALQECHHSSAHWANNAFAASQPDRVFNEIASTAMLSILRGFLASGIPPPLGMVPRKPPNRLIDHSLRPLVRTPKDVFDPISAVNVPRLKALPRSFSIKLLEPFDRASNVVISLSLSITPSA